jgi:hypothetical protein
MRAYLFGAVGFVLGLAVAPYLWDELGGSPAPVIHGFTPVSAPAGAQIAVTGNNFLNVTAVAFGGVATSNYIVNSPAQITVTVPPGANSGRIGVAARGGVATSGTEFKVLGIPVAAK